MYTVIEANIADVNIIRAITYLTYWATYSDIIMPEQINYMLKTWYSKDNIQQQILNKESTYLLLKEEADTVAFAAYALIPGDQTIYRLQKLYCLPKTQGKGYGRILINRISNIAFKAGAKSLILNVHRDNKYAVSFYQKMGFEITGEEQNILGPYQLNDYVMRKSLPTSFD